MSAPEGTTPGGEPQGVDLARAALAAARKKAKELEDSKALRSKAGRRAGAQRRSGSRSDDRDPQALSATIGRLMSEHGWETPVAVGGVVRNWAEVVGERIAEHCVPLGFADGVLTVQADSPAWAVELRHLSGRAAREAERIGAFRARRTRGQAHHGAGTGQAAARPERLPLNSDPGYVWGYRTEGCELHRRLSAANSASCPPEPVEWNRDFAAPAYPMGGLGPQPPKKGSRVRGKQRKPAA
jgi:predicted nucleic acid-binding Zn ribbon protein